MAVREVTRELVCLISFGFFGGGIPAGHRGQFAQPHFCEPRRTGKITAENFVCYRLRIALFHRWARCITKKRRKLLSEVNEAAMAHQKRHKL